MSETLQRRGARAWIVMLVSLLAYTALDLGTKEWALDTLSSERTSEPPAVCQPDDQGRLRWQRIPKANIVLIEGRAELGYAENCGAAFGMFRTAPAWVRSLVFGFAALAACVVLAGMFMNGTGGWLFAASVPLVLSGAIGNLADRIRHGYVVDFIVVHLTDTYTWPTFNIADSTITVGVVFLLLDGMKKPEESTASDTAASASE